MTYHSKTHTKYSGVFSLNTTYLLSGFGHFFEFIPSMNNFRRSLLDCLSFKVFVINHFCCHGSDTDDPIFTTVKVM